MSFIVAGLVISVPEKSNKINAYICEKCRQATVTVNACDGTTPFMIQCRANNIGCGSMAQSSMYQNSQDLLPKWEWYRPGADALSKMDSDTQEHVRRGGLILRKLSAGEAERYGFRTRRA